jgi:hypothetical protein
MNEQNKFKIVRRTFEAFKYPRGSIERNKLNKSSFTSEFARKNKFLVVDENNKPLKSFRYISECREFIENPDDFRPKHKIKKYTRKDFMSGKDWYEKKRRYLKG